jgi:hypothetical protein
VRRAAWLLIALAWAGVDAKPNKAPAPPAKAVAGGPSASVTRVPDGERADLTADGTLLGWAAPLRKDGRDLFLLVGEPGSEAEARSCTLDEGEAPRPRLDARLYRWSRTAPTTLRQVAEKLPRGTLDAADLERDGIEELLLFREGHVDEVADDGTLRPLLQNAALGARTLDPRSARANEATPFRLSLDGRWTTFRRDSDAPLRETASLELPVRVFKTSSFVRVIVPEAVPIGSSNSFATFPETIGNERLRTALLQPDAEAGARSKECWAQLPESERLLDVSFAPIDGVPSLIVTTMSAEKLNIFGEKRLRVFTLSGDRTRAGESPRFAALTGLNIWQSASPVVDDLDGDGHDDLVLGYWKGLKNSIVALEIYPGKGNGGFAKPKTTDFDVADGDKAFLEFGKDVDGDGRPDLILLAGKKALVFPGQGPGASKAVLSQPSRAVPLLAGQPMASQTFVGIDLFGGFQVSRSSPGLGTPRVLDVDRDGRPELLFAGDLDGHARVSIVFFRGAASQGAGVADNASISYK